MSGASPDPRRTAAAAALGLGGVGGFVLVRRRSSGARSAARARSDAPWRSVTIFKAPDEVAPGGVLPAPLAALGDLVETRVRPAPGDRGTELGARLRRGEPHGAGAAVRRVTGRGDPRQLVRSALREAKQLVEVGEVLRVDPAPHGRRTPSPAGRGVETATRRAGGEGLL